jgi:hypothetical protein
MSKMGSHDPFGFLKHKLWPKEKPRVKFDFRPLKVKNLLNFIPRRWCVTYLWKSLYESYNFSSNLTLIRGLHTKLWASKIAKNLILGISGLPFGSPETKWQLGAGPMAKHKEYYKGEGDGFPQVWVVVSLMNLCLLVTHLCTKGVPTRTNQLVVWFVHVHVTNWLAC